MNSTKASHSKQSGTNSWKIELLVHNTSAKTITLSQQNNKILVGREVEEDEFLVTEDNEVSRKHCKLYLDENNKLFVVDFESANGTYINGNAIHPLNPVEITGNCEINITGNGIVKIRITPPAISSNNNSFSQSDKSNSTLQLLQQKKQIVIGRGNDCEYIIDEPSVSRRHAIIYIQGNKYYIEDLNSTNGVYVNKKKITTKTVIELTDTITIGNETFSLGGGTYDDSHLFAIQAIGIEKRFKKNKIGLHELSLAVQQGQLIGIMGPSGCGKSTLLKALNGESPTTKGKVLIKGWNLIDNYDLVKTYIGYVPQDDILHRDLTVEESLFYTAKLRLADPTPEYIEERIQFVLQRLKIDKVRKNKIGDLSGGQRKRVCIASELLTNPAILFLDEPTSPLDPQTIEEFLKILKELAKEGTAVLMVTHKPEDLEYLDKVVFLATGGHMVFYDDTANINTHFEVKRITNIYSKIDNPSSEETIKWITRYKTGNTTNINTEESFKAELEKTKFPFWLQVYWLVRRNINIKWNDKSQLIVPILGPPIITFIFCLLFNYITLQVIFLVTVTSIFFGIFTSCGEIVKEQQIYVRERTFNLRILPYLLSKIIFALFISTVQAGLMTLVIKIKYDLGDTKLHLKLNDSQTVFAWLLATYLCAAVLGLFISAVCKKMEQVNMWVPYLVLLQIIFGGVMTKLKDKQNIGHAISCSMISRWSTEGLCRIQDTMAYDMSTVKFMQTASIPAIPKATLHAKPQQALSAQDSANQLLALAADTNAAINAADTIAATHTVATTSATKPVEDTTVKKEEENFKKISALNLFIENFPDNYKNKKMKIFGDYGNTLGLNAAMLLLLFSSFFGLTFYSLKRKDSI
jgi:ABC-type multidrug transport system ATPase subunit/pSer/pThr/pTyr-binding forkhead associated (FHA) protein